LAKTQPIKEDVKKNAVFLLLASGRQMVNPVIGSQKAFFVYLQDIGSKVKEIINLSINKI